MEKEEKKSMISEDEINRMKEKNKKIISKLDINKESYSINVKRNIFGWVAFIFVLIIFIILIIFMVYLAI
ncbi:hypothetical protein HUN03_00179 [Mycoplasmopsis anatis]|uniref:Uncharacterized protein n=2 Tax=Mycoplasmopsis anatis TaxID=171279 RepID=A0A9Q3QE03_9BACT|nr:hypothetical protein [Mycoplasmopsis anatis]MBW0594579.1 hypothetical protein [Mycoplasmopsis anatis]MBW0595367.1 hypothetical protein [Mycoplasmopsis anatis]MBW0596266.1 hypothetical protein [Mycoplasmopsis anatis]MBW0597006.1 hypothetical protein [Mycoplasmopsis anatis]MBW0597298.1 hypothetical protein [Mycoplasmopsis anatis]